MFKELVEEEFKLENVKKCLENYEGKNHKKYHKSQFL